MLEIRNVKKKFTSKKGEKWVLKGIDLKIEDGTILGLIGMNGAGKTTLIKCLCGLISQSEGSFYYDGCELDGFKRQESIGVMLEGARNLYHFLTVEDNLEYFGYLNHLPKDELDQRKENLLQFFGLSKYRNQIVNELSRGTQQKVAIMVVLMKDPKILILDEPTLGLDLISTIKMKNILKEITESSKRIVVLISHDMNLISSICDRIVLLEGGMVTYDESAESIKTKDLYHIKIEENKKLVEKLSMENTTFNVEDGVVSIKTDSLDIIGSFLKEYSILSIEKEETTLEDFLQSRIGEDKEL